jgi:hypothetical protein
LPFSFVEITAVSNFRGNMPIRFDDPELAVLGENIYENYFSQPFIRNTEKFYQSQSVFDIEHGTILKYLEKVIEFLRNFILHQFYFDRLPLMLIRISKTFIHICLNQRRYK